MRVKRKEGTYTWEDDYTGQKEVLSFSPDKESASVLGTLTPGLHLHCMGGEAAFEEELDLESRVDRPVESQVEVVIVVDLDFDKCPKLPKKRPQIAT